MQLSMFAADNQPPEPADLAGLLAAGGQALTMPAGARVSIVVQSRWRGEAIARMMDEAIAGSDVPGEHTQGGNVPGHHTQGGNVPGNHAPSGAEQTVLHADIRTTDEGGTLVRTVTAHSLIPLARAWTKGAAKRVPEGWVPSSRALRLWTLAAGRTVDAHHGHHDVRRGHYVLGLDPHAEHTHAALAAAIAKAGIAATPVGPRAGGPGLRVTGRRRLTRLAQSVGQAPPGAGRGDWPQP